MNFVVSKMYARKRYSKIGQSILAVGVACTFGFSTPAWAEMILDLEQAIALVLKQNRSVRQSSDRLGLDANSIVAVQSDFKTQISPDAIIGVQNGKDASSYGFKVVRRFYNGTELVTRIANEKFGSDDGRSNRVSVEWRQPLLANAGRLVNEEPLVRAQQSSLSNRRSYELTRVSVVLQVISLYYEMIRLQQQTRADKKTIDRLTALFKASKAKESLGWTTRVDTLRVELQLSEARSRQNSNQDLLRSAARQFSEILAMPLNTTFKLKPPPTFELEITDEKLAIKTALKNRLDFAQVLQDFEDANRGVKIAKKRLKPALQLVTRYTRADDFVFFDNSLGSNNRWSLQLTSNTDFHRRREKAEFRNASIEEDAASQAIEIARQSIIREVRDRLTSYRLNRRNLTLAESSYDRAESRLKLARRLFDIGRETQFTVSDAEEAFLQTENQLLLNQARVSVSGYQALEAMGLLIETPKELRPDVYPRI
ncbi:outer membrane efflux protein [bacterium BMS3Abin11]|nr:outer membrane efflux protein [bacterium BMS3Abin11]